MNIMSKELEICISLYGTDKLTLLYALLASIVKLYGDNKNISVNLLVQDVPDNIISEVRRKVNLDLKVTKYCGAIGRDRISGKMNFWKVLVDSVTKENVVLLDVDTVLVRDIRCFFQRNFGIGFTYKTDEDENLAWPINTGVILLQNNPSSKLFFTRWTNFTREFILDCKNEDKRLEAWGGTDQASFGYMVNVRTPELFSKGICVDGCFVQGFPCKLLNETRCKTMENCYVIHYKGWFQKAILSGEYNKWRTEEDCKCMKEYWDSLLNYWKGL